MKPLVTSLFLVIATIAPLPFSAPSALAGTYVSDFATGLDGWQPQWHKESPTGTDGVVTHTTERGYNDTASLLFDMGDGFGDDGTLWIEKMFTIDPGVPTEISVAFQQFSLVQSDFNTFQVKAAISTDDPNLQADFTTIGSTDSVAGWAPFEYNQLVTSDTGEVWVAVGIRVAWETPREFWIDQVVVTTTPIPEPTTLTLVTLAGTTLLGLHGAQRRRRWPAGS